MSPNSFPKLTSGIPKHPPLNRHVYPCSLHPPGVGCCFLFPFLRAIIYVVSPPSWQIPQVQYSCKGNSSWVKSRILVPHWICDPTYCRVATNLVDWRSHRVLIKATRCWLPGWLLSRLSCERVLLLLTKIVKSLGGVLLLPILRCKWILP